MTRRHFEALADALGRTNASDETVAAVARVCGGFSGRFDRGRFEHRVNDTKVAHGHTKSAA